MGEGAVPLSFAQFLTQIVKRYVEFGLLPVGDFSLHAISLKGRRPKLWKTSERLRLLNEMS